MLKIIIVGLGLIGGSVAKALRDNTSHEILGIDTNENSVLDAISCGAVDGRAALSDIKNADIVYLCAYPEGSLRFAEAHKNDFKSGAIVVDSCGIKVEFCEKMLKIKAGCDFVFVGAHPMAGKEKNGFSESTAALFTGASYIITPCDAPDSAVETVSQLALKMGFGNIKITTPENHDRMIAYTSQLPHVLACAYVMSPAQGGHNGFSAGSYRDVSRVADINAGLWTELFIDNRQHLVAELDVLIDNINAIKKAAENADETLLCSLLQRAGDIKRGDNK